MKTKIEPETIMITKCIICSSSLRLSSAGHYPSCGKCYECRHPEVIKQEIKKAELDKLDKKVPKINVTHISGGVCQFRERIRARDNWTCQICFKVWETGKRRFDVHHLDKKLEGRSAERGTGKRDRDNVDRIITLCHKCHLNLPHISRKMSKSRIASYYRQLSLP